MKNRFLSAFLLCLTIISVSGCRTKNKIDLVTVSYTKSKFILFDSLPCYAYNTGTCFLVLKKKEGDIVVPVQYTILIDTNRSINFIFAAGSSIASKNNTETEWRLNIIEVENFSIDKEPQIGTASITQVEKSSTSIERVTEVYNVVALDKNVALIFKDDANVQKIYYLIKDWQEALGLDPEQIELPSTTEPNTSQNESTDKKDVVNV